MKSSADILGFEHQSFVDILSWRAANQAEKVGYKFLPQGEDNELDITYRQLDLRSRAIGAALQSYGKRGDRVMLLLPPGMEFLSGYFGGLYAGMIAIPLYPPQRARMDKTLDRLVGVARDAEPVVILTTAAIKAIAPTLFEHAPILETIPWITLEDIEDAQADHWINPNMKPDELAFLQYTSGSTNLPKGVMVSHGNLVHNSFLIYNLYRHDKEFSAAIWLPPYHDMGLIGGILQPMYAGVQVVLMSPIFFLQRPLRWLKAISKYKIASAGAPNFAFDLCVDRVKPEQVEQLDLSTWKVAFSGAEPIHPATLKRFAEYFKPAGFRLKTFSPSYGLAESTLMVTGVGQNDFFQAPSFVAQELEQNRVVEANNGKEVRTLVGCGVTLEDTDVRIVDPATCNSAPVSTVGEIWVKGPSVAQGYWRNEEATEHAFRGMISDTGEGPYMRTGDLGFIHKGQLYITGRLKDLIIIDGSNHYPQDIERTAMDSHEMVLPNCTAAFSISDNGSEKLIVVAEVDRRALRRAEDREVAEEGIKKAIRKSISKYHELKVYDVMLLKSRIPKTTSGKIQRHMCKKNYLAEVAAAV